MEKKHILLLIILFILINLSVYFVTQNNLQVTVNNVLKNNTNNLSTHYNILSESQKNISYAIYKSILRNTDVIKLLEQSYSQSESIKSKNRKFLYEQLREQYKTAKKQGVLQIHFIDRDNITFLRVHKPDKFGDDLTDVREDYNYVKKYKKPIRGFSAGKTAHGFRNTFPIFDNNEYIGAMEVSFSSERLQWYLNNISHIHTHFLVRKDVFDSKAWNRDDLIEKYVQSSEAKDFMLNLNKNHTRKKCVDDNHKRLHNLSATIERKMKENESFSVYTNYNGDIDIVSFLPIENISHKNVAWIVSYTKSLVIKSQLESTLFIRIITFCISLLVIYFLAKQIISKKELDIEYKLVQNIIDTTQDIIFITDFKDIKRTNKKFNNFFYNNNEINKSNFSKYSQLLDMFVEDKNCLHKGLLKENETFISLFKRSKYRDRIVLLKNKNHKPKSFQIYISQLENKIDYLITLTDITQIKKDLVKVNNKAYTDGLTGVYNRNKFDEIFEDKIKVVKRYDEPLSIALIDIDKFKNFNDTYGHLIGDEVLITMAKTVEDNLRETDIFARWGGEEFVILFPKLKVETASKVANKVRIKIEENEHKTAGKVTASFGLTQYQDGDTIESIFKRCDDALYIAKKNGRNRVEIL